MATLLIWMFLWAAGAAQGVASSPPGSLPQAPRDPRAKPATGTGTISGKVTGADTRAPIRRAEVSLNGPSGQKITYTDAEGRYQFSNLPRGTYNVSAHAGLHRGDYQPVAYGATSNSFSAGLRGKPLQLNDGERLESVDIALPRTGAITGHVTDPDGQPASRVKISAWIIRPGSEPTQFARAETDDLGQFRVFGLLPGDYILLANPSFSHHEQGPEIDAEPTGFAPTYAPGTPQRAAAARFRVGRGTEVSADIRLTETRLFSISGTATNSQGETPRSLMVMLVRSEGGSSSSTGVPVSPSGSFTFRNVTPGDYDVIARYTSPRQAGEMPGPDLNQEFASVKVDVATTNLEGLMLVTKPGVTVTGEIVFEDPVPPGSRTNLFAQTTDHRPDMSTPAIELKENMFTMRNVFGPLVLRGSVSAGPGWGLKAVLLNGKDITDVPTTLSSSDSGHLQVVFTGKAPALEGIVIDEAGKPTSDASIVIFGHDRATWQAQSSFLRTMRPVADGKYAMNGLREGRYFAVALPLEVSVNTIQPSVDFLESLSKVATPLVLNAGEKRMVDLTVVRIQPQ